jgi:hypothetical protein
MSGSVRSRGDLLRSFSESLPRFTKFNSLYRTLCHRVTLAGERKCVERWEYEDKIEISNEIDIVNRNRLISHNSYNQSSFLSLPTIAFFPDIPIH